MQSQAAQNALFHLRDWASPLKICAEHHRANVEKLVAYVFREFAREAAKPDCNLPVTLQLSVDSHCNRLRVDAELSKTAEYPCTRGIRESVVHALEAELAAQNVEVQSEYEQRNLYSIWRLHFSPASDTVVERTGKGQKQQLHVVDHDDVQEDEEEDPAISEV
jgi:hypothetical protein